MGPAGIEPAYAGLRPAANPSQLETRGREARTRTSSAWAQARSAYPYTTSRSGPAESNRVSPESESGRLPSSSIPRCAAPPWRLSASPIPSAFEPWSGAHSVRTLAQHGGDGGNRTRCDDACRACPLPQLSSPRRCGARYSQSPGVAGLSFAASLSFGRRGGLPIMVLTLWIFQQASTFTLGWCSAGTAGVEPAFRSGWSRAAYRLADP